MRREVLEVGGAEQPGECGGGGGLGAWRSPLSPANGGGGEGRPLWGCQCFWAPCSPGSLSAQGLSPPGYTFGFLLSFRVHADVQLFLHISGGWRKALHPGGACGSLGSPGAGNMLSASQELLDIWLLSERGRKA